MNHNLINRLANWKFNDAAKEILTHPEPEEIANVIHALSETFGNSGWFSGSMGEIVTAAVQWTIAKHIALSGEQTDDKV